MIILMNHMVLADDGSDCRSPLHTGCKLCNPKNKTDEPRYCIYCNDELKADEYEVCEYCLEHKDEE